MAYGNLLVADTCLQDLWRANAWMVMNSPKVPPQKITQIHEPSSAPSKPHIRFLELLLAWSHREAPPPGMESPCATKSSDYSERLMAPTKEVSLGLRLQVQRDFLLPW
eukprot:3300907-Amphidinium_carterae.1